ncbi:MAG: hypothetical protein IJO93_02390 [Clostridia bacterium]|nr:hypothetical protein [Clostridia bacterium]
MTNPLKYLPQIAAEIKTYGKNSREYHEAINALTKNKYFMNLLMETVEDSNESVIEAERAEIMRATTDVALFGKIAILAFLAAAITWTGVLGETLSEYALYIFAAAVVAVPFSIFSGRKMGKHVYRCIEHYIDTYCPPDSRFDISLMTKMVRVRCSLTDVIDVESLKLKIPCGCYFCKSRFPSDELRHVDGQNEYVCPVCGRTTVISERCGEEISEQLLDDMHDYWLK